MNDRHFFHRRAYLNLVRADLWRIDSGVVRATTWLEDGSSTTLGFWGAGAVVGNTCLRSDNDLLECLTSVTATPLLAQSCGETMPTMLAHIQQLQELLLIRSCKRIEDKLLKLLAWLSQRFGTSEETGMTIDIFLTHQDLAEALCTTRVTITRSMRELERQGTIRHLDNRRLSIHQSACLSLTEPFWSCLAATGGTDQSGAVWAGVPPTLHPDKPLRSIEPAPQQLIENLVNFTSHGSTVPIKVAAPKSNRPVSVGYR